MNNKGQITVFISLIMGSLVLLGLFVIKLCTYYVEKSKAVQIVNLAISDVKSGYNSYIFEHYHILLFDKTEYGKGEAAVEEVFCKNVENNLDDKLSLDYVAITDFDLITDNDCEAFKSQINDYTVYAAISYGADEIMAKTGGKDAVIDEAVIDEMDADTKGNESEADPDFSEEQNGRNKSESENGTGAEEHTAKKKEEDPRDFTKIIGNLGILYFVIPDDLEVSTDIVDLSECPTKGESSILGLFDLNNEFDSYNRLKKDLKKNTAWNNSLIDAGCGLAYAKEVFNCAVNQEINEESVFKFELEYLVCGKPSDYLNLKKTVNRIVAIRFPVDFSYLLTDVSKMTRVKEIAMSISLATAIPEPVLKYLIAGCWSYVESVSDVRELLKGNKVEFEKNKNNWKTDINHLGSSLKAPKTESDRGMTYEDYLLILIALNMNTSYKRMLDVIQLNTRQIYPDFKMENAAVGLTVDAGVVYEDNIFNFSLSGGY